MTPAWIRDIFAALVLVVAGVSAARLLVARPWRGGSVVTDTDVAHLLMTIAMAGKLTPGLITLPDTAWEVIFGLLTAWFGCRVVSDTRANGVRALADGLFAPYLAHSAAMLYMFLAAAPAAGGGPTRTLQHPALAFVFALILSGYSVWDLDQTSGSRYRLAGVPAWLAGGTTAVRSVVPGFLLSPATTVGCRIIMGVTMAFMLLSMI